MLTTPFNSTYRRTPGVAIFWPNHTKTWKAVTPLISIALAVSCDMHVGFQRTPARRSYYSHRQVRLNSLQLAAVLTWMDSLAIVSESLAAHPSTLQTHSKVDLKCFRLGLVCDTDTHQTLPERTQIRPHLQGKLCRQRPRHPLRTTLGIGTEWVRSGRHDAQKGSTSASYHHPHSI